MHFKQIVKKIKACGWQEVAGGKGSHVKFKHADFSRPVTVPSHGKRDIPIGTVISIEKGTAVKLRG